MLIGIDIGGTSIKMGIMTPAAEVRARHERPFRASEPFDALIEGLAEACTDLEGRAGAPAGAIGVCLPGYVDREGVLADGGANVALLRGRPLVGLMAARFGHPVHVVNDGVAAGIGEIRFGAGRGLSRLAMLTLGTGVGGCVAVNGTVMTGPGGEPPELGAMVLADWGTGPRSLESFASAAGFLNTYREAGGEHPVTDVRALFARLPGDRAAAAAVDRVARRIAQALGSLINALALDGCILGGGIAGAGDLLIEGVRKHLPDFTWPLLLRQVSVLQASRGNDAGLIGAASLAGDALAAIRNSRPAE
jgi:glucokinase